MEHEILVYSIRILLLYCLCMEEGTNARGLDMRVSHAGLHILYIASYQVLITEMSLSMRLSHA